MSGTEIGLVIGILSLAGAVWWRVYTMIRDTRTDLEKQVGVATAAALLAREQLSDHKTHVAETYVTKAGMSEQTAQIMRAIEGLGSRIDGIHERLDGWSRPPSRARAS